MRGLRASIVIVGVLGAFVLGTSSVASASVAATKDPCKLLKQAEIQKVIGLTVSPAEPGSEEPGTLTQCYWRVEATAEIAGGAVGTVVATSGGQLGDVKTVFEGNRQAVADAKSVPGVKNAFYNPDFGEVSVLRGDLLMNVSFQLYDTSGNDAPGGRFKALVKLTKKAVKRLG